jgi:hypothetical protein
MPSELTIISHGDPDRVESNLISLSEFFGVPCKVLRLSGGELTPSCLSERLLGGDGCLALSPSVLRSLIPDSGLGEELRSCIYSVCSSVLVYGMKPGKLDSELVAGLTCGLVESVAEHEDQALSYEISGRNKDTCAEYSGLSFGPVRTECDFKLMRAAVVGEGCRSGGREKPTHFEELIRIDGHPFFAELKFGHCRLFLLANGGAVDLDSAVGEDEVGEYFSRIVPIGMFLRSVFKELCRRPGRNHACLVVDDPLLSKRYGFLKYEELLKVMDRHDFSTNIGFIPHNYRRDHPGVIGLFKDRPDRYSICVHGCDHTRWEFGVTDERILRSRTRLAVERMLHHRESTGIRHNRVMIFPQGVFSSNAMKVLGSFGRRSGGGGDMSARAGFVAAVNSGPLSCDGRKSVRLLDLLEPAVMSHSGFALFLRRYPERLKNEDIAWHMFFGKPVLIVEHHMFFKKGYDGLIDLVSRIHSVGKNATAEGGVVWTDPETIAGRTQLIRRCSGGEWEVSVYASEGTIVNPSIETRSCTVRRYFDPVLSGVGVMVGKIGSEDPSAGGREYGKGPVSAGRRCHAGAPDGIGASGRAAIEKKEYVAGGEKRSQIHFAVRLEPGARAQYSLSYEDAPEPERMSQSAKTRAKIHVRRRLSEFRDNYISRSELLLSAAYAAKRLLSSKG